MTQTKSDATTLLTGKWKSYPAYKDSGVEWLGKIPVHWEVKRLKYVIQNGLVNGLFKKKDQFGSGTKLVNVIDLYRDNFLIDFDSLGRVETEHEECETFKVLSGDIFFVRSSLKLEGVGSSATIIEVPEPTVFECHVVRLRPSSKFVISKYLINYLNSSLVRQRLVALAETTTMTTLSQPKLASIEVVVPDISEQHAITDFLDRETAKINAMIAKKERLVELLQEKRAALISQAVTKGLDPTVPMKDSGIEWLGEIPAHWEVRRLKYLVKDMIAGPFGSSLTKDLYTTKGFRVYGQEQVIPADFSVGDYYISEDLYSAMKRYAVSAGDVLISCVGTFGKVAVVPSTAESGIINPRLVKLVPNKEVITPNYLGLLLRSQIAFEQMEQVSRGGTMGVINLGLLSDLQLPLPLLDEQDAIVAFLDHETAKIDALISRIREGVEKLKEYSTALISAAVAGKIDVRGEATPRDDAGFPESDRQ